MFTIKTSKKHTIVNANHFVVGTGYKRMLILAEAYGGKVDTDKKSKLAKITFGDTMSANEFAKQFTQEYAEAHKAYTSAKAELAWLEKGNTKGVKLFTKATPSSSKKTTKGKGNKKISLNDFVVNNPSCTREEAKAYGFKGTRAELKALKVELGVR